MKITDCLILDSNGDIVEADPHGNNIAFCCMECRHPIVAVALENQRGWDEDHPATWRKCEARYFLDIRAQAAKLYIHVL